MKGWSWTVGGAIVVGALVAGGLACRGGGRDEGVAAPTAGAPVTSHQQLDVRWEKDWDAAFARARAEGKPVLVSFYADWCVWCKVLDSTTYRDSKVERVLAEDVVPLSVDIDRTDSKLLERFRIDGPPTIVLLDSGGRELGRIPGYMPPTPFLASLEGILHPAAAAQS